MGNMTFFPNRTQKLLTFTPKLPTAATEWNRLEVFCIYIVKNLSTLINISGLNKVFATLVSITTLSTKITFI